MGILGLQTEKVEAPDGAEYTVRRALSFKECERAKFRHLVRQMENARELATASGFASVTEMQEANAGDVKQAQAEAPAADPRESYDLDFAAARLVREWPYENGDGKVAAISAEHVGMLRRDVRDWLHNLTWSAMRHHIPADELEGNS